MNGHENIPLMIREVSLDGIQQWSQFGLATRERWDFRL